jgi:hypothetical protein
VGDTLNVSELELELAVLCARDWNGNAVQRVISSGDVTPQPELRAPKEDGSYLR